MHPLLAALLLLQSPPAPSEADKIEAALKKFGDRTYRVIIGGQDVGGLKLTTRIESVGDRKIAVFKDRGEVKIGDEEDGGIMLERASLDGLRLISDQTISLDGSTSKEVTVSEGKAVIQAAGDRRTIDVTPSTVGGGSVFRLVAIHEQKVGASFKIDMVSGPGDKVDIGHHFTCVARETVEAGGKKRDAFKWVQKFEEKKEPGGNVIPYVLENHFWVDPEGYLLRTTYFDKGKIRHELVLEAK